jgi:DivIVA domain-containing protein
MVTTPSRFGSRVDLALPRSIAAAEFSTVRRGYDRDEVRALLGDIADEFDRLHTENSRLHTELEAVSAAPPPELDEATATALLGEEAARVLTTAKEAASNITAKAHETADRILQGARDEATRLREDAALEASRQRERAGAETDAEIDAAKAEGRQMVAEARAVRERMLADLVRRRDWGRAQLERLRLDRDRLVATFEDAGRAVDDVLAGLRAAAPDPAAIETVEEAQAAVSAATGVEDRAEGAFSDAALAQEAEVAAAEAEVEAAGGEPVAVVVTADEPGASSAVADEDEGPPALLADIAADGGNDAPAAGASVPSAPEEETPSLSYAGELDDDPERRSAVVDLFARLRASGPADVVADLAAGEADAPDKVSGHAVDPNADYLAERNAALHPVKASLARHLKRAITDEQNEVLDTLRRWRAPDDLDALVGSASEQTERYHNIVRGDLESAAVAGSRSVGADPDVHDEVVASLLDDVQQAFVEPLRERLARALTDAGGDTVEASATLRAAYREWRAQRADEVAEHLALVAHGRAAFAALAPGAPIHWVVDPEGPLCPDADDNALAGDVVAGTPFPTGHCHAPAHPGCCCGIALSQG